VLSAACSQVFNAILAGRVRDLSWQPEPDALVLGLLLSRASFAGTALRENIDATKPAGAGEAAA
jgi:hypothetical protein